MRCKLIVPILLLAACSSPTTTTALGLPVLTTTTTQGTAGSTAPALVDCPPAPYRVSVLPSRVSSDEVPPGAIELDPFTAIGGTRSVFWTDSEGKLAVALIRGTLPPEDFPGEKGEVEVAGTPGVAGPFDDGKWVVAWFEGEGQRCDLYTMVFYPPVEPSEVEATIASIERVEDG